MYFHLCLFDWATDEQTHDPYLVTYIMRMGMRTVGVWPVLFKDPPAA